MRSAIASDAAGVGMDATTGSGVFSGSGAIGVAAVSGLSASSSAAAESDAAESDAAESAAGSTDSIGSVLLISIEGLESEDAGLIGSVSMASAARCGLRKLKGVVTCRFEDAAKADVFVARSRDKMS
jgi:hypothetical protein